MTDADPALRTDFVRGEIEPHARRSQMDIGRLEDEQRPRSDTGEATIGRRSPGGPRAPTVRTALSGPAAFGRNHDTPHTMHREQA